MKLILCFISCFAFPSGSLTDRVAEVELPVDNKPRNLFFVTLSTGKQQ